MKTARGDTMAARAVTSPRNPSVRAARRLARRGPDPAGTFLVEGPQAVAEAVDHLERLFATAEAARRDPALVARITDAGVPVLVVPQDVLASLASTVAPQGLVGVATLPLADVDAALSAADLAIVCVEARDPGNVGTILRSADAAGAAAVLLAGDCVDPRNAKAVRASAGSLFHLPVARASWAEVREGCRRAGLRLVAADARAPVRYSDVDLARPTALVLGGEAHGLPDEVRDDCDTTVAVPIRGRAESLNLAATAAVLAFEAARQRDEKAAGS